MEVNHMKKIFYVSCLVLVMLFMGTVGALAVEHYPGESGSDEKGSYCWEYLEDWG